MSERTIEDLEVVRKVISDIEALRQRKPELTNSDRSAMYGRASGIISRRKNSSPEFAHAVTEIDEQYHGYPLRMAFVALSGATSIGRQSSGQVTRTAQVDPSYVAHVYDVCRALEEVLAERVPVRTPETTDIVASK